MHKRTYCQLLAGLACIFQRHIREQGLSRSQALALREAFLEDVEGGAWTLLPISDRVLRNVEASVRNLPRGLYLRAGDAIHLVSARDAGFAEIWSNDRHLLGAAARFVTWDVDHFVGRTVLKVMTPERALRTWGRHSSQ